MRRRQFGLWRTTGFIAFDLPNPAQHRRRSRPSSVRRRHFGLWRTTGFIAFDLPNPAQYRWRPGTSKVRRRRFGLQGTTGWLPEEHSRWDSLGRDFCSVELM